MLIFANKLLAHLHCENRSGNSAATEAKHTGDTQDKYFFKAFALALNPCGFLVYACLNYLSAGKDKHQGSSSSSQAPGEQGPQQGLGHGAVAFQHGA